MLVFLRAAGFMKHEAAVSVNIERPGLRFIPAGGGLEDGWGFRAPRLQQFCVLCSSEDGASV